MDLGLKPPAELAITEDDAAIAEALETANIPTLMMSIIHLTGDASILDGDIRPVGVRFPELNGFMEDEKKARVRAMALDALKAYRDGRPLPPPPADATVRRMADFLTGTPIAEEYLPMLLEEMALDGVDQRVFDWTGGKPPERAKRFHTVVIGAGMSGLLAAIRLKEAGLPFVVIEKNQAVGGTWYENQYPGARVDSANHFYSYSFEPNHDWSEHYSRRDELFAYFDRVADRFGIRDDIRFSTEVVEAVFDEAASIWRVTVQDGYGARDTIEANAVISAVGQLNRPKFPDIKGRDRFGGPSFHSAEWQTQHDLTGKRIAVIGVGASAFQLIPEVAKIAGKLTVFQRSPGWMVPNAVYHDAVKEGKKWLMKHVPYYARWYRFLLFWMAGDALLPSLTRDDDWPHPERSMNALNEAHREAFSAAMRAQLPDRPDIAEKVVPKYPPFGKRMLQDNGHYLGALARDNVELVTDKIAEIVEDGIIDETGRHHPLDVIVYATGFQTNKFLWPMRIVGREGQVLSEVWGDMPRAYLGITIPGFPNLFCLYGPGTNLAHAGSIIFHSECQVRYAMGALKTLIESGHAAMECKPDVFDAYVERLDTTLAKMVWSHPGADSWYRNARGIVVNTSPWRLIDYWNWTRTPEPADYRLADGPVAEAAE